MKLGSKVVFIVVLFIHFSARGQSARKYVNEFMYLGTGARQIGMGKAAIISTQDAYSGYWNPAGLAKITDDLQLGFMHNFYFQSIANYDFLSVGIKGRNNTGYGFSILRFGIDGILNTLDLIQNGEVRYDQVKEFSSVDYVFMPSFGKRKYTPKNMDIELYYGGTAKIIHRRVGEFAKSWGFGLDASFLYLDRRGKYGFGAVMRDATTTFNNWSFSFTNAQKDRYYLTGNEIPVNSLEIATPRFDLGGFFRIGDVKSKYVMFETFLGVTTDGKRNTFFKTDLISGDLRMGTEAAITLPDKKAQLALRAGFSNYQLQKNQKNKTAVTVAPSVGLGIKIEKLSIDYALAGFGNQGLGLYSHIVSVTFAVNKLKK